MALTAGDLVDRAAGTLNDPAHAQWSEADLLEYLSDAQRLAVQVRPQVNPVNVDHALVAGPEQTLPDDGFVLLDVFHNGPKADPGPAISKVSKAALDQGNRDWYRTAIDLERQRQLERLVKQFVYEPENRKTFWIAPYFKTEDIAADSPRYVRLAYAQTPGELTGTGDALVLDDIYQPALLAYMFYRAFMKDIAAEGQGMAKAMGYLEQFMTYLLGRRATNITLFPTAQQDRATD